MTTSAISELGKLPFEGASPAGNEVRGEQIEAELSKLSNPVHTASIDWNKITRLSALTMRKNSDNAAFFSANSAQKPKFFGNTKEGKEAELNYKLSTQLPYMFVVSRLAHYIKVIQRENIGTWKERGDLENELNIWIRQYVADMDSPGEGVRSRRPLRQAEITVADVEGDPGWYRVDLKVRPHFKYMGASFSLSLVGKLEKK
jgi:type VI secretion system protein ImpC